MTQDYVGSGGSEVVVVVVVVCEAGVQGGRIKCFRCTAVKAFL